MRKVARLFVAAAVTAVLAISANALAADVLKLGLTEAVEMAYAQNLSYKAASLDLKSAELALAEAEANALTSPSPSALLQARLSYQLAQATFAAKKGELMINVADSYFAAVKADSQVVVSTNSLKSSQDNLKTVEAKFASGVVTQLDVIKQKADVFTKESSLETAKWNRDLSYLKLKQLLRLPAETTFELTSKPVYQPVTYDVEADVATALKNRTDIIQAANAVETAKKDVELNTNDYTTPITLEKSKVALEKALIALDNAKDSAENEVRTNYINLLSSYASINTAETNLASANENLRVTKLRYNANMVTQQTLIDAENAVLSSSIDLTNAIASYQIAKLRYLKSLGVDFKLE